MRRLLIALSVVASLLLPALSVSAGGGFDACGWNYGARTYNGTTDGLDGVLDGLLYGRNMGPYINDRIVMQWSKGWEDWMNGLPGTPDAWRQLHRNGQVPGGSGESEHNKVIWVGPLGQNSPYWRPGGRLSSIPGFEIIFYHGSAGWNEWVCHANPAGLG